LCLSLRLANRFVVDAADHSTLELARNELHNLLKPQVGQDNPLAGIPLLVLGNKKDLPGALTERELIERLDLQSLAQSREVCTYTISGEHTCAAQPLC